MQLPPESPAVSTRAVTWTAVGALLLLAVAIGAFHVIYQASVPVKAPPPPHPFPQPRVDTLESEELHRLLAAQKKEVETWRWADDKHTLVQIPIKRAMKLLVEKGKDAYAPLLPPQRALSSPTAGAQRATTPEASDNAAGSAAAYEPHREKQR
jgi:hypothetical protein